MVEAAASSAFRSRATDPNMEVKFDFSPFLIQYKSGRVQRLMGTTFVPASMDSRTGVASRDVVVDHRTGLAVRLYRPSRRPVAASGGGGGGRRLPVLVYFHDGAFVVESAFDPVYHNYRNALRGAAPKELARLWSLRVLDLSANAPRVADARVVAQRSIATTMPKIQEPYRRERRRGRRGERGITGEKDEEGEGRRVGVGRVAVVSHRPAVAAVASTTACSCRVSTARGARLRRLTPDSVPEGRRSGFVPGVERGGMAKPGQISFLGQPKPNDKLRRIWFQNGPVAIHTD